MIRVIRSVLLVFLIAFSTVAPTPSYARSGPVGFADMAEKLLPSVVNISTTQTVTSRDNMGDFPDLQFPPGSPFEEFFRDFMEQQGLGKDGNRPRKHKSMALGSGFIIDANGYIVTNNHVIQDADEITVILQDDTNLPAKVVGRDKKTDLALLKVTSKKPLTAVNWGDSDKVRVGDWIVAIGNPFGLGGTVTAGIISARARDINSGPYDDYLQTDASINRGNSGGPMFDMDGNVIGVNAAIYSPSGGSVGIGFAIPSSMAKSVIEQLKANGHTKRGWLGVRIQVVTPEIAEGLNLPRSHGALVSSVTPNGPAEKAKLEPGDVIINFDGKDIPDMRRLPRVVAETEVNKTVPITVIRRGKEVTLNVTVGELEGHDDVKDDDEKQDNQPAIRTNAQKVDELGFSVAALSEELRQKYNLAKDIKGIVVVSVDSDGPAAEKGIQSGDVIGEITQQDIKTTQDLVNMVKQSKKDGRPLLLLINRKGDLRFIAFSLSDKKKNSDN